MPPGDRPPPGPRPLLDADYRALARFRSELRRFLEFSEHAAREAGLTPQQHQALLAVRGHAGDGPASVSDVAEALHLQLHSTTELLARAERAGLLDRVTDPDDRRRTLCVLTPRGRDLLEHLTGLHRTELVQLRRIVATLDEADTPPAGPRSSPAGPSD